MVNAPAFSMEDCLIKIYVSKNQNWYSATSALSADTIGYAEIGID